MGTGEDKELIAGIILGLKKLRKEKGLSQRDVLYDTGILISRIETGKHTITLETLNRLCAYFGITIKEFFAKYY